ncbi:hypothetical protein CORC01_07271 [Colletotrichum orchidophilum]|uniref:Uncharacterized protein n=1 Tax=Colletotrichum orchidophilum TaxID=1209926 RepID=A0A1G4B7R8_9PEZI|nr:uncharacterized protein CORC01_07271 [Colletotrichum orchidophilum]OHE97489.1 hypothetical protein CORC01_07271 [Colletotrichum orchidophilum]
MNMQTVILSGDFIPDSERVASVTLLSMTQPGTVTYSGRGEEEGKLTVKVPALCSVIHSTARLVITDTGSAVNPSCQHRNCGQVAPADPMLCKPAFVNTWAKKPVEESRTPFRS